MFPAFFLGALSVLDSPYDTFVKLEVCNPHRGVHTACAHRLSVVASLVESTGRASQGQDWGSSLSRALCGGSCRLGAVLAGPSEGKSSCHSEFSQLMRPSASRRAGKRGSCSSTTRTSAATGTSGPRRPSTSQAPGWT